MGAGARREQARGESIAAARTAAVNALVMGEIFYLFNCRFLFAPSYSLRGGTPEIMRSIIARELGLR